MNINNKYYCKYCDKLIGQKGFSYHLKMLHEIKFLDYVKENILYFPSYHICQICNENITTGKSCSRVCASILQIRRQTGKIGWSRGLTKEMHSGLNSMSEKAKIRNSGRNIWSEMPDDIKKLAKQKIAQSSSKTWSGRKHTKETIKKMRLSTISYINSLTGQTIPRYNKNSIKILENLASELNITDLQHAENGGEFYIKELGYWVDGYSKEKNIVIEFDEPRHYDDNGELVKKDKFRQEEIESFLKCQFIRIKSTS